MNATCGNCGKEFHVGADAEASFTMPQFTNHDVILYFCSQGCKDDYESNGFMEGEEDYYSGEREVDSDPYD